MDGIRGVLYTASRALKLLPQQAGGLTQDKGADGSRQMPQDIQCLHHYDHLSRDAVWRRAAASVPNNAVSSRFSCCTVGLSQWMKRTLENQVQ